MKQNDSQTLIAFRLPAELAAALRKLAEKNDRSVSGEVRRAVQQHLKETA